MSILTGRDSKLLETLGAFGMLSTRQIGDILFTGIRRTTLCRRLRGLEKDGRIQRVRGLPDGSLAWILTRKAAEELGVQAQIRRVNRNTLEHDVTLGDIRIRLSRASLVTHWAAEHELRYQAAIAKYQERTEIEHVPDAILTVKVEGEFRAMALELERRVKGKARYEALFLNYLGDVPIWAVWYLVPNERVGQNLEKIWTDQAPHYRKTLFIWSNISDFMQNFPNVTLHMKNGEYPLTAVLTP